MTLPEHAICSLAIGQLGISKQLGWKGVLLVMLAGISPDFDSAGKLIAEEHFWKLHHALGHSVVAIACIAFAVTFIGRFITGRKHLSRLFWVCLVAAFIHCATDSLYWWGVKPLWPFHEYEITFNILEYLDLVVLAVWLIPCILAWKYPARATQLSYTALGLFATYVAMRVILRPPTGMMKLLTGGWIYAAPNNTPVLDWW